MKENERALTKDEWSEHYNIERLNSVLDSIKTGSVSVWAKELTNICVMGSSCLEIGCGTGISSLWLAKNGRSVTALDYTDTSIELVKTAAEKLDLDNINAVMFDATKELPFEEKQFDYIFQAGLLEHFETDEQIRLLNMWSKYGKHMISLIPNSASIPYRVGKQIMEDNGTWEYGLEIPRHSLIEEFVKAGIEVEKEYTIGTEWAESFLPRRHYVKKFFDRLRKDGFKLDDLMQGYLIVTIGKCT